MKVIGMSGRKKNVSSAAQAPRFSSNDKYGKE